MKWYPRRPPTPHLAFTKLFCFLIVLVFVSGIIFVFYSYRLGHFDYLNQITFFFGAVENETVTTTNETSPYTISLDWQLLDKESANFKEILKFLDVIEPKYTVTNISSVTIDDGVIVTGFSSNHHSEAIRVLCKSLSSYTPLPPAIRNNLIVYLLDEQPADKLAHLLKQCPIMKFRKFPFKMFPEHVKQLTTYSFKILIVALMLKEYKFVLWSDTSTCFFANKPGLTVPQYVLEMARRRMSFAFNHPTDHSIFSATNPAMYKYIPIEKAIAINRTMAEASIMHFIGTKSMKQTILLRAVQCSLIKNCIAPAGSKVPCTRVPETRRDQYFNCHRFDQSAVTLIASAYTNRTVSNYLLPSKQWSTPRRGYC